MTNEKCQMTNVKSPAHSGLTLILQPRHHSQSPQPDNTAPLLRTQRVLPRLAVVCKRTNNYWRRSGESFPARYRDTHRNRCTSNRRSRRRAGFLSRDRFDQALAISDCELRIADFRFEILPGRMRTINQEANRESQIINPQSSRVCHLFRLYVLIKIFTAQETQGDR